MKQNKKRNLIQISEDLTYLAKFQTIERIGWGVFCLIILAALLGFTGSGGVFGTETSTTEHMEVTYPQFARQLDPIQINVFVRNGTLKPDGSFQVWIDRAYLKHFQIQDISPQPDSVQVRDERLYYTFGNGSDEELVTFQLLPQTFGYYTGTIGQDTNTKLSLTQVIYP